MGVYSKYCSSATTTSSQVSLAVSRYLNNKVAESLHYKCGFLALSWPQSSPSSSTTSSLPSLLVSTYTFMVSIYFYMVLLNTTSATTTTSKASLVVSHHSIYVFKGDIGKYVGAVRGGGSGHCDVWRRNCRNRGTLECIWELFMKEDSTTGMYARKTSEIKRTLENI